jgi:hypothetical protein
MKPEIFKFRLIVSLETYDIWIPLFLWPKQLKIYMITFLPAIETPTHKVDYKKEINHQS